MGWFDWLGFKARNDASIDPNFGSSMQFYTPGQPIWSSKDYASFVRNGYRKNPNYIHLYQQDFRRGGWHHVEAVYRPRHEERD
jgi:hypothetical protein